MARSGRIHLPDWELDSECRRVVKKFDSIFKREVVPFAEFKRDGEFERFWLDYFARTHGATVMPRERIELIFSFGIISHIGIYRDASGKVGGYTLEVATGNIAHDWYQAWSPEFDKQSFGMWLLIETGRAAKERGATYYYPGTFYGNSNGASYKTNLPSVEYWNGESWVKDDTLSKLKSRLKTDSERKITLLDEWKQNHPLF
jgi:hypothetical protein